MLLFLPARKSPDDESSAPEHNWQSARLETGIALPVREGMNVLKAERSRALDHFSTVLADLVQFNLVCDLQG